MLEMLCVLKVRRIESIVNHQVNIGWIGQRFGFFP